MEKLYEISMTNKIIISMSLPALDETKYVFKSYKVLPDEMFRCYLRYS